MYRGRLTVDVFLFFHGMTSSSPDISRHDGDDNDAQGVAAGAEHVRPGVLEDEAEAFVRGRRRGKLRQATELAIVKPFAGSSVSRWCYDRVCKHGGG